MRPRSGVRSAIAELRADANFRVPPGVSLK